MGFGKIDWRPTDRNTFSFDLNAMHWRSPHGIQTQAVLTSGNMLGNNGNSTVQDTLWQGLLDLGRHHQRRQRTALRLVQGPALRSRRHRPLARRDRRACISPWPAPRSAPPRPIRAPTPARTATRSWRTIAGPRALTPPSSAWTSRPRRTGLNQLFNGSGSYTYTNLLAFAKDFTGNTTGAKNYTTFTQQFGNPIQNMRTTDINFYAQDTWKLSTTADLELRHCATKRAGCRNRPSSIRIIRRPAAIPPPNKDFAPRVSLSYSLNDRTVIRAGYGIFYARVHRQRCWIPCSSATASIRPPSRFRTPRPAPRSSRISCPALRGCRSALSISPSPSPNFHNPYAQQGNVTLRAPVRQRHGFDASYIWSHGVRPLDQPRPQPRPAGSGPDLHSSTTPVGNQVGTYTTRSTTPRWIRDTTRSFRWKTAASPGTTPSPFSFASACRRGCSPA